MAPARPPPGRTSWRQDPLRARLLDADPCTASLRAPAPAHRQRDCTWRSGAKPPGIPSRSVSRHAGDRLDEALFRRLSGGDPAAHAAEAILIATIDERGRAHPALLSYGEVLALTPDVLRIAVSATSATARNLATRGALTMCVIGPDGAAYLKTAARPLPAEPFLAAEGLAAFEARVEDVLVDAPAAGERAHLTSGITFAADDPAAQARAASARREGLRRAPRA